MDSSSPPDYRVLAERIANLSRLIEVQQTAADHAAKLQATEFDRRLEALNHIREEMLHRDMTYLSREVYDEQHSLIVSRVESLEALNNRWGGGIGAIAAIVGLTSVLIGIALGVAKLLGL